MVTINFRDLPIESNCNQSVSIRLYGYATGTFRIKLSIPKGAPCRFEGGIRQIVLTFDAKDRKPPETDEQEQNFWEQTVSKVIECEPSGNHQIQITATIKNEEGNSDRAWTRAEIRC